MKTFISLLFLTPIVAFAQPSKEILKDFLDSSVSIVVPVATNRVTTISFPSAITAIDGAGVTVDGKTPGLFQLAHTKGSAFLSVRALFPKASANLNVRWNDQTYVFGLTESDQPVLSLNMAAMPVPEDEGLGHAPEVSPIKLLSLLDKAKAFPLLKQQQPESVSIPTLPVRVLLFAKVAWYPPYATAFAAGSVCQPIAAHLALNSVAAKRTFHHPE
jgi:hypothetical protein